jgi:Asp-tRNA(Asn)/Glu-tRNA(Gln) amidotransferase A subunit family amidase
VVEEVELPSAEMMQIVGRTIIESEAASLHRANWDRLTEYSPDLATRITNGQSVLAVDYLHALRTRHLIQRDLEVAFRNVDALIAPTTVCTPPRLDTMEVTIDGEPHHWKDVVARTTRVFSVAGTPAISVPSGWVGDLPVGIQVVAPPHDDALCLRVANAFQAVTDDTRLPELRA